MVNIRSPRQLFPLHTVEVEIVRVHPEYLCLPGGGVFSKLHCIFLHSDMATDDISIVTGDHHPVLVDVIPTGRNNCRRDLMFTICRIIAPVGWEELEVTRKELYVAGEELEV